MTGKPPFLSILFNLLFCLIYVCPSFAKAHVLSFMCSSGACAQATTTHLSLQAIIQTAATVLTLGIVGYVVLKWLTYRILSFIIEGGDQTCGTRDITVTDRDQTEVKRGGSGRRTWESEKVVGAKTWRWEVRAREGKCTETRRVDGRWSILNSSIRIFVSLCTLYFKHQMLRHSCVQRSSHKRFHRSKNNIKGRLATKKHEKLSPLHNQVGFGVTIKIIIKCLI